MYRSDNKQYVFKTSSGNIWNVYYDEKLGICCSTLYRHNAWSNPISLQKNVYPSFYADIDNNDCFNILFQDKQGNILYSLVENGKAKTVPVLNSKSPTPYNKHLFLLPIKNRNHFFYVLRHGDSSILAHQMYTDDKVDTPKVIDYVSKDAHPFSIVHDKSDNIYAFYKLSDGKYSQIGYKKYMASRSFWGEFIPIARQNADCEFPRTVLDSANIMHICYQRHAGRQYELVYQQKVPDRNLWTGETVIHSSAYPFLEASMVRISDVMVIFWVRNDTIFYSHSKDTGSSWSKPAKYNFPAGRQLICLSYRSNSPYEIDRIHLADIPGSFINGLKLAFYQDAASTSDNLSADDLKSIVTDTLKTLKANIDELKEAESDIRSEITRLAQAQQVFEREMEKYSVKLGLIDNQLREIKLIREELKELKKSPAATPENQNKPNTADVQKDNTNDKG